HIWLRRRPRFRQAAGEGRHCRDSRGSNHRHRRQSALRGSAGHYSRHSARDQIPRGAGDPRSRRSHRHGIEGSAGDRSGLNRGKRSRGLPNLRRNPPLFQRPQRSAAPLGGRGMKRTLSEAARVVGGELIGEDRPYGCVCTDSRTLKPGALFVALRGPNFDGGAFVQSAAAQGAIGALVERATPGAMPQVLVPNTLQALQELAKHWRAGFALPVVAVAGSNGKTTAKEMTAAILSRMGLCMATHGNLNNHIGVPVTLMRLEASHRSAVIEMGANAIGDVAALMRIAQPTVGLITNAGAEHLEGFGNLDGVAKGEGETVSCLEREATAIINADDPYAGYWRGISGAKRIVTFGVHHDADFTAKNIFQGIERGEFATRFTLHSPLGERAVMLKAGGAHNIGNALAAAAAASAAGASLEDIVLGLADFRAVAGRLQLKAGTRGSCHRRFLQR